MSGNKTTELIESSLGNFGSKEITGTSAVTPATGEIFGALYVVDDCVVSAQTDKNVTNADLTAFLLIPAGTYIYGRWSSITLSTGSAIGYYE